MVMAEVFRKKGYHAASMDDLAKACALQKGSLYHYFESKEQILRDIIQPCLEFALYEFERIHLSKATPESKLRKSLELLMTSIESHLNTMTVLLREDRSIVDPYKKSYVAQRDRLEDYVEHFIKEGIKVGVFRKTDTKLVTKALFGMCNWAVVWYHPDGRLKAQKIAKHYADLVCFGLATRKALVKPFQKKRKMTATNNLRSTGRKRQTLMESLEVTVQ
jgi:AcrR family transcriptional regulator